jgi:hypothetical protein
VSVACERFSSTAIGVRTGRRVPGAALRLAGAGLAVGLALAGCARQPVAPVELTRDELRERFTTRLASRRAAATGLEAEVLVWARISGTKLPGATARLLMANPDHARVRVGSAFGTAVDLAFTGDSARVWLPAARAVLMLDDAGESLGVRAPGRWLVRAMSADWEAPDRAWATAVRQDSDAVLAWEESAGESIFVRVGRTGLPREVRRRVTGETPVRMVYDGWEAQSANGATWPVRGSLAAETGGWSVAWRVSYHKFVPAPSAGRFHIAIPRDATRLTLEDVRRVMDETVGGER